MSRMFFIAIVCLAGCANSASAGDWNSLGRFFGLGWSEGYHAYNGCPTCEQRWVHGQASVSLTPYYSPGPTAETLVAPRTAPPVTARPNPSPDSSRRTAPIPPSQRMTQQPVYRFK